MADFPLRAHVWLAATLFPAVECLLPLRAVLWLAERPAQWKPYGGVTADRIIGLVARRLRRPWMMRHRRCYRHGILLFHFLRLAGIPATLRFGVLGPVTSGRRLKAHCWVDVSGREIDPPVGTVAVLLTRAYPPVTV